MLVESADEVIVGHDLDGVITFWNRAAERLYGYRAKEVLGKNVALLLPQDRLRELEEVFSKIAAGGGAHRYETSRVDKDGSSIDIAVTVSPIRDAAGIIVGTSTIARDITERNRTRAVNAVLAAIVDSSNDAIIGKTLQGVITTWNRGAEILYGYALQEVVGKSISLLVPPERRDEVSEIIAGMLAANARIDHFETQRLCKDGRVIDVSLTVSPIRDSNGTIVGASSVARDITERNVMAAALKATENAVAMNRAKDEMVSLVSHELRTPLASLLGFTELLCSRNFPAKQRRQYLEVMLREGRRLTDLIDDVLQVQRLDAGHQSLNLAPADMEALIRRAVATAGEDTHTPIEVNAAASLPLVMVDPDAILQVLGNFLSNARKYSPQGGTIVVTAREVGEMIVVDIRDHGLGLPADAVPKLFGTFYRVDSGDRLLIKGTGLGLAINRKIVEAHHGHVGADSDGPGHGSRFHFTLPAVHASGLRADVLIVEDDTGFERLLREQFTAGGLTTVRASDAETAERLLKQGLRPRAFVVDLLLPGVQGEELVTKLGLDRDDSIPVVVLTVKTLADAEVSALGRAGVTAVLAKEAGGTEAAVALICRALASKAANS
jgi:PAS domain S-box-containing protein